MHKLIIPLILILCINPCHAQDIENVFGDENDSLYTDEEYQQEIKPDTVLIKNTFLISPDSIAAIKKKKEFAYVPLMDSLLRAQDKTSPAKLDRPVSMVERFLNSRFFRFFVWLIPISLLLFVLYNFLKSRGSFTKKKQSDVREEDDERPDNTNLDYLKLAQQAADKGEFRVAVKYLFLRTLQQLSAGGHINYASDKTNYNYVQEIASDKKKDFARLVLNYEYVWYGNAIPDRSRFMLLESEFQNFFQKNNLT